MKHDDIQDAGLRDVPPTASALRLCYVDDQWAFFTSQPITEQWGDDWNDAPYEHNAEEPYEYGDHDRAQGRQPWTIVRIAWRGPFITPSFEHVNSPYSVEAINRGAVAWLRPVHSRDGESIHAGATLDDFCRIVQAAGGEVYCRTDLSGQQRHPPTHPSTPSASKLSQLREALIEADQVIRYDLPIRSGCGASPPSPSVPEGQGSTSVNKGHIDSDCEVARGVGWMCTCETPEEKAEPLRELADIEAERDAASVPPSVEASAGVPSCPYDQQQCEAPGCRNLDSPRFDPRCAMQEPQL